MPQSSRTPSPTFLVDLLLPSREVHLLGGPSGAGKTRWLLQTILEWEEGRPFLDFKSHPVPWIYIAADRTLASVKRTMVSMGIDYDRLNIIPAWDKKMGICEIQDKVEASGAQLVVWESFGSFVEPPAQGKQVKQFMNNVNVWAQKSDLTVIGVVESPKQKPYERYENPRQRVSGAASWGHHGETIMLVEPVGFEEEDIPSRRLTICTRNGPQFSHTLTFDMHGKLLVSYDISVTDLVNKKTCQKAAK